MSREIHLSVAREPANASSVGESGVYVCAWDQDANEYGGRGGIPLSDWPLAGFGK